MKLSRLNLSTASVSLAASLVWFAMGQNAAGLVWLACSLVWLALAIGGLRHPVEGPHPTARLMQIVAHVALELSARVARAVKPAVSRVISTFLRTGLQGFYDFRLASPIPEPDSQYVFQTIKTETPLISLGQGWPLNCN